MRQAILATKQDALDMQAADDSDAGLPWPSVYLDGTPCPTAWTLHRYDVRAKPDGKAYAYPVDDTAQEKAAPGSALSKATCVEKLDVSWDAKAEPVKGAAIKEP